VNQADSLIFQTEKQLKEFGDKVPADKKAPIESALEKLKAAHKSSDLAQIDSAITELNGAWTAASEDMYKATQDGGAAGPNAGAQQGNGAGTGATDNVTDAEYEEVK